MEECAKFVEVLNRSGQFASDLFRIMNKDEREKERRAVEAQRYRDHPMSSLPSAAWNFPRKIFLRAMLGDRGECGGDV